MKLKNISSKNILSFIAPVSFLLLASCSSYQYSGYEDGIYGESNPRSYDSYDRQNQNATQDSDRSYYKNLFAEEAALYGEVLAEDAIFTDVDSYSSTGEYVPNAQDQGYVGGNAPWGEDPDSYDINFYNNGFMGYGGFYNPFWGGGLYAYDPFWGPGFYGPGWGPGFYGPGMFGPWGRGWGWGMGYGGGWAMGYGGFGFGGFGFGGHPFFGNPWYNPYNFYGNRYDNFRHQVAYNNGRRDAASYYRNRSNNGARTVDAVNSRGRNYSGYSRSIRNLRGGNDDFRVTRRSVSRDYEVRRNSDYNQSRVFDARSNRSRNTYSSPMRRNNSNAVRSNTSSSRNSMYRGSSSSRSSGAVRSSSGGRSSSGSSSRGRGN